MIVFNTYGETIIMIDDARVCRVKCIIHCLMRTIEMIIIQLYLPLFYWLVLLLLNKYGMGTVPNGVRYGTTINNNSPSSCFFVFLY